MKFTEFKSNSYHFFQDKRGYWCGEYKSWYESGQRERVCFHKNHSTHGEHLWWRDEGDLFCWSLYMNGKELLRFNEQTGFDNAEEVITKKARELNLPLLKDIPLDRSGEEMLMWELKYPNIPLLPISEKE